MRKDVVKLWFLGDEFSSAVRMVQTWGLKVITPDNAWCFLGYIFFSSRV